MSSVSGAGASPSVQSQQAPKTASPGTGEGSRRFGDVVREKQSTASQEQPKTDDKPKADERRNDDKVRDADKDQKADRKDEKKADRPKDAEAPKEQKVTDDGKGKGGGGGGGGGFGEGELASLESLDGEEQGEAAIKAQWDGQVPSQLLLREQSQPVEATSKTRSLDKIFPKEAIDKVVKAVRVGMNEQGLKEVQIDLKAEALEGLKLKISQGKDGVKVEMLAETQQVRDLMAQRVDELSKVLQAKGIQVNELTVRTVSEVQTDNRQFSGDRDGRRKPQEESAVDGVGGARRRKKGAVSAPPPPFDFSPPKKGKIVKKKGGKEFTV